MGEIIGIDTAVFIYLFEDHPIYAERAQRILDRIEDGSARGVFSIIGMIELLTGPKRLGRHDLALRYRELLSHFPHLSIVGITERVVDCSSDLRATYHLRTPDAIHLATAIATGARTFVTHDRRLQKVKEISVQLL